MAVKYAKIKRDIQHKFNWYNPIPLESLLKEQFSTYNYPNIKSVPAQLPSFCHCCTGTRLMSVLS